MLRWKDRSIGKEEQMAAVFDLVAFFMGLCTSFGLSSFFFYNYSVCSEVIKKMFGALVSLRKPLISCNSTIFVPFPWHTPGKITPCPGSRTQYALHFLNFHL